MNTLSIRKFIFPLVALPVILACALPVLPTPAAPEPTVNPGVIETIVVATAGAAQTQTALVLPSPASPTVTLPPTSSPTETLTATATIIFIIPTATFSPTATSAATATQSAGENCQLISQSPANGTRYGSRDRFDVEWTIRNTSDETWISSNIDFFHSDGRDMHETDIVDLPRNVRAGDRVTLGVEMRAPGNAGTYTSTWTLGTRNDDLCTVSIRIVVR